jgi:bifunctional non-homologous end joining protein LigD
MPSWDGEIVHLGPEGIPLFYSLMRRRPPQHFYAFDLLWLDGRDLRGLSLIERKAALRTLVPPQPSCGRHRHGAVPGRLRSGHGRDRVENGTRRVYTG